MIKPENYGKITENSRNLPEKSLKNPKNLPPADGWGAASPDRRGFLKIFDDGGIIGWSPLWIFDVNVLSGIANLEYSEWVFWFFGWGGYFLGNTPSKNRKFGFKLI